MRTKPVNLLANAAWALAAVFVGLAAVGAARYHTDVPILDMWEGYLRFFLRVQQGDWREWWALHNEHRIVLSRLLFWMDLAWFGGSNWLLLAANGAIVAGACLTSWRILRQVPQAAGDWRGSVLRAAVVILLFSWMQRHNFVWGFQSQFLLAHWLPLLALFLLHLCGVAPEPAVARARFAQACAAGVLSVGTMANGIAALPLLVAYAVLVRMPARRTVFLFVLAVVTVCLYLLDYRATAVHGEFLGAPARDAPWHLPLYVLALLGSPVHWLLASPPIGVPQAFGAVFVALFAVRAVRALRAPRDHARDLFLVLYLSYILATATVIAAGRLTFGIEHALSGRYSTTALMGWAALLLLHADTLLAALDRRAAAVLLPALALGAALSLFQLDALRSRRAVVHEWEVGALALELGVQDEAQIHLVHPDALLAMEVAREASRRDVSVFGRPLLRGARERIGAPAAAAPVPGAVSELQAVPEDARYRRASGWFEPGPGARPQAVDLVNAAGVVVGHALVRHVAADGGARSRFKGFVLAPESAGPLRVAPAAPR